MRITGSLFTHAEMSASIADATFLQVSGSILTSSNQCVTVTEAVNTLRINPILGSGLRLPFYHELIASGSVPPVSGSVTLTYFFDKGSIEDTQNPTFVIQKFDGVDYENIVFTNSNVSYVTTTITTSDVLTAYMYYTENPPFDCTLFSSFLALYKNGVLLETNIDCPNATLYNVSGSSGQTIEIYGTFAN